MTVLQVAELATLLVPASPLAVFVLLAPWLLLFRPPSERFVSRLTSFAMSLSLVSALFVSGYLVSTGHGSFALPLGTWLDSESYGFEASLLVDGLSAPMMLLTAALCGLVGRFSATYLVGEPGHARFYLLLTLFAAGMFILVMAGSLDLLIAGWELVGLSSMLLIGFFHERTFPVRNALRAFTIYRVCDLGLLSAAVLFHHHLGSSTFPRVFAGAWPHNHVELDTASATLMGLSLLWAASGKSALFPLSSWLPRAMEGPTPSSAIFYGALSVHAGAYLLLRCHAVLDAAPWARGAVIAPGLCTALSGTLVQKVQSDVKSQLAYATITQVGVIFVEIGLGFSQLALLHLVSHALLRTLQMLRAPNALHDARPPREREPARVTPFGRWLYHLALERFHLDLMLERGVARPLLGFARSLQRLEERWLEWLAGPTSRPSLRPHASSSVRPSQRESRP